MFNFLLIAIILTFKRPEPSSMWSFIIAMAVKREPRKFERGRLIGVIRVQAHIIPPKKYKNQIAENCCKYGFYYESHI
jgi:hypothetical protein